MTREYSILLDKLDTFIKKYYLNKIIRGSLISLLIYFVYNSVLFTIEYFSYLSVTTRTIIFYSSLLLFVIIFVIYILLPLLKYFNIGKKISYNDASRVISSHFSEVEDTLLNILQLADTGQNTDLVLASIDQKIHRIKPLPILKAINFKNNKKYLKYYLLFFVFFLPLLFLYPGLFVDGAERIINHNTVFEPKAPFNFKILNDSLSLRKGGNITIELELDGKILPGEVEIQYGNYSFYMTKKDKNSFTYDLENINNTLDFSFMAGNYSSRTYTLEILPIPFIKNFLIEVFPPVYTNIKRSEQSNNGNITVPQYSDLHWKLSSFETNNISFIISDTVKRILTKKNNIFSDSIKVSESLKYAIVADNDFFKNERLLEYTIQVIPDLYPEISVNAVKDSSSFTKYYFNGLYRDDYGFSKLTFNYYEDTENKKINTIKLPINKSINSDEFYFMFDFANIDSDKQITYYFEIFDNDPFAGFKSVKSSAYTFKKPTKEEIEKISDKYDSEISSGIKQSQNLSNDLEKNLDELREKLLQENVSDWEKKQLLENILEQHKQLQNQLESVSQENKEKNKLLESLSEEEKEILEKQKQIEEMLEKVMDSEMKDLLDELQKLMNDFDKNKFFEISEDMKLSYDDLSEQLDKNLEMLKRFDIEKNISQTANDLKKLAEEQKKLSEEMKKNSKEENSDKIDSLMKEFQKEKEKYKEQLEKNKELETPFKLDDFSQEFQQIEEQLQDSKQQNDSGKQKKASDSMKNSSEQTESLSSQMDQMMQANMQQQTMEDLDNLRQIIDNLLTFSFLQEDYMDQLQSLSYNDPKFAELSMNQNKLKENFEIIKDSLYALASRIPAINSTINKEVLHIRKNIEQALGSIEQLQKSAALRRQQEVITATNNLALLLSEIVEQMQQSAAQQMSGQQQCQNPSSGAGAKPSLQQMKGMQQSMKEQLKNMIDQMKEGGSSPGSKGATSKEMGKMLAQQQQYREMLNKMMQENSFSPETMQKLKEIQKMMDRNENDIINKNISPQTLFRQDQIITRLLESERAERERDLDNKRKSEEAQKKYSDPKKYFENISEEKRKFKDQIIRSNIKLNTFYQKKYDQYLLNLNNNE